MASDSDQGRQGMAGRPREFKRTWRAKVVWNLHIGQWAGWKRTNKLQDLYNGGKHAANVEFDSDGLFYASIWYAGRYSSAQSTSRARGNWTTTFYDLHNDG